MTLGYKLVSPANQGLYFKPAVCSLPHNPTVSQLTLCPVLPSTKKKQRQHVDPYLWVAIHANRTANGTRRPCGRENKTRKEHASINFTVHWGLPIQKTSCNHPTAQTSRDAPHLKIPAYPSLSRAVAFIKQLGSALPKGNSILVFIRGGCSQSPCSVIRNNSTL